MDNITSDSVGLVMNDIKTLIVGVYIKKYDDEKKFIADIPKLFKKLKFVIVNVFDYETKEYETNMDFCIAVREKLESLHVPFYFINPRNFFTSMALIRANITVKLQEAVLSVRVFEDQIHRWDVQYTENGYKKSPPKEFKFNQNESHQAIREKILGSTNYKRILLVTDCSNEKLFRSILKSKKLIVLERGGNYAEFAVETAKWFFDRSYTKFHVIPTSGRICNLFIRLNQEKHDLIGVSYETTLPFEKTVTIPKIFKDNVYTEYKESLEDFEPTIQNYPYDSNCHGIQATLTVDINNFTHIKFECATIHSLKSLPEMLDGKIENKIPVIAFYGCPSRGSSVICVHGENGYKFLDSWNGEYGKELIIGFDKKKPTFCDLELLQTKPPFVVYDLINIMSMPADNIQTDKLWTFTVTNDIEHPVLLEFDTYDGTKKAASPAFLMAMLLKHHLKVIKKETGIKPPEIGIYMSPPFDGEERTRVEDQMNESCELLKIGCFFV